MMTDTIEEIMTALGIDDAIIVAPRQVYTFVYEGGETIHIDSHGLFGWCRDHAAELETFRVPVDHDLAREYIAKDVVALERVKEIHKRGPDFFTPIILCRDNKEAPGEGASIMLVDGHHRYVLFSLGGHDTIPAYVLEQAQWRPFQINGLPAMTQEEVLSRPVHKRSY